MPSVMLLEGSRRGRLPQYMSSLGANNPFGLIALWITSQNAIVGAAATLALSAVAGATAGAGAVWLKDRMR